MVVFLRVLISVAVLAVFGFQMYGLVTTIRERIKEKKEDK